MAELTLVATVESLLEMAELSSEVRFAARVAVVSAAEEILSIPEDKRLVAALVRFAEALIALLVMLTRAAPTVRLALTADAAISVALEMSVLIIDSLLEVRLAPNSITSPINPEAEVKVVLRADLVLLTRSSAALVVEFVTLARSLEAAETALLMADFTPEAAAVRVLLLLEIELEMSGAPTTTCNIVQFNIMIVVLDKWLAQKEFLHLKSADFYTSNGCIIWVF